MSKRTADRRDLVVVGAGSAGITAARTAAGLGARVTLVERARTGGDCLWTGCVPSKALLAAAQVAHTVRIASRFGVHAAGRDAAGQDVDFPAVLEHVRAAQRQIEPVDSVEALRAAGIDVLAGSACFVGAERLAVDGRVLPFRTALVATGSEPTLPPIPGLDTADALTSETVWALTALPDRLVVLGGGAIGCELGQAFARFGSQVTVVEAAQRVLAREEPAASRAVSAALVADGAAVHTGTRAVRVDRGALVVRAADGAERTVGFDALLVCVGRRPRSARLDLDAAGVRVDDRGFVVVDDRLRTTNPRIFAAGDVTGAPPFTHVAGVHGSTAAFNALLGPLSKARREGLPWVTFTDPEVARVGLTVSQARERHGSVVVRRVPATHIDRAVTEGRTEGSTLLVGDGRGRLVGATVISPHAGETISELAAVISRGGRIAAVARTVHPYPTYGDGIWTAATTQFRAELGRSLRGNLVRGARQVRACWLDQRRRA